MSSEEIAALTPVAMQVRDAARAIIQTVFGKDADVIEATVNPIKGSDIETTLAGEYILVEVNLQGPNGDLWPCLTFLHPEEVSAAFDLGMPDNGSDWSAQAEKLQHPVELLVEQLNTSLDAIGPAAPSFTRPSVRPVNLPEEASSLLLPLDDRFLEVQYQLNVVDVGPLSVTTIASTELAQQLSSESEPVAAGVVAGTPAGAARADDLLARINDPFANPTGRTPADILDDFSGLGAAPMGGMDMAANAPTGYPLPDQPNRDGGIVRPVQFQQFGDGSDREPIANLDLIMDVNLRVTVELGRTSRNIREILELGPGTIIELDKLAGEPVDILVNEKPIAKGEVVVADENFAVRVTEIISPARRVASLR